jgi:N-acetylmuramoyl-L-alanine amidase
MNVTQRLTVVAGLLAAALLVPVPASAAEAPSVQELTSKATTATSEYGRASKTLGQIDQRIAQSREKLNELRNQQPKSESAVVTAVGAIFSPRLMARAEKIAANETRMQEIQSTLDGLQQDRFKAAQELATTKARAEDAQKELAAAQQAEAAATQAAAQAAEAERIRLANAGTIRLMVDPGHGGHDPGAVGNGLLEKDTNLQIAWKVQQAAVRQGWNFNMTRVDDTFVPLPQRPAMAAAWGATEFVSIHSNSSGASLSGMMTINRGGAGAELGQYITNDITQLTPYGDPGNVPDVRGLAVLRGAHMPATLVEVLSVSEPSEAAALADPTYQTQVAEAIVRGIAAYHGVAYVPPTQ